MNIKKKPLYRKENKTCINWQGNHRRDDDFKHERHTKKFKKFDGNKMSMKGKRKKGYDYTPLYRFLHSKVGQDWNEIYSEAKSRLDKTDPIFYIVEKPNTPYTRLASSPKDIARVGEGTYWHTMYIDENKTLQFKNKEATIKASCNCCTHTLDGKIITYSTRSTN